MSNYTKATNFATKDSLPSGNPAKIVKGTEINDEFDAIEVALNSKADINSPVFTGDPRGPTPTAPDNDTSLATTSFVKTVISTGGYVKTAGIADDAVTTAKIADDAVTQDKLADDSVCSAQIIDNCVTADELNVSGNGTAGQALVSDGDGSFSWDDLEFDPAAGATGTTSIPIGAMVLGEFNTSTQNVNHWTGGYGSTQTLSSTAWVTTGYNWLYTTSTTGAIIHGSTITINSGTWRLLGGGYYFDPNVNANWIMIQRIS